jgi:hypothetical protein
VNLAHNPRELGAQGRPVHSRRVVGDGDASCDGIGDGVLNARNLADGVAALRPSLRISLDGGDPDAQPTVDGVENMYPVHVSLWLPLPLAQDIEDLSLG